MRTVRDCVEAWLAARRPSVRETTWLDYLEKAERYILPSMGSHSLAEVGPAELEALYRNLADRGLSRRSLGYAHAILRPALDHAVRSGFLAENPARTIRPPREERCRPGYLTPAQHARFLVVAGSDPLAALWYLIASAGLLPAETVALRWDQVDPEMHSVRIDWTLRGMGGGRWGSFMVRPGRRRSVPLSRATSELLRSHYRRQRVLFGDTWTDARLVFTEPWGGPIRWKRVGQGPFQSLLVRAGLPPVSPRSLRYSCAEQLLLRGLSREAVARQLGYVTADRLRGLGGDLRDLLCPQHDCRVHSHRPTRGNP